MITAATSAPSAHSTGATGRPRSENVPEAGGDWEGGRKRKTSLEKLGPMPVSQGADQTALLPEGGGRSRRQRFRPLRSVIGSVEQWSVDRFLVGRSLQLEFIKDALDAGQCGEVFRVGQPSSGCLGCFAAPVYCIVNTLTVQSCIRSTGDGRLGSAASESVVVAIQLDHE